jgi:hypothetical protein
MARLRDARKIENAKQRKACPSLADVPWLQRLLLESGTTMDPYDMGRRLAVALRVDDTQVQGADLAGLGRRLSVTAGIAAVTAVKDNIREGNMAGMWMSLQAFQRHVTYVIKEEYNEARALAVLYPQCVLITELCAGRDQQVCQLPVMFEQMTKVFTDAATQSGDTWLLGCWDSFFEGFEVKNTATAAVHAGIMLRGQAVLDGSGGSPGAKGGPGGAISGGGGTVQTRGAATPQGVPATPGKTPGGGGAGGAGGSGGGGAGAGAGPGPTAGANNLKIQKHAPVSAAIVGAHMGSAAPAATCWECNIVGHYKGECPTAWGRLGHPLPGWTKDGKRKPGDWNGGEPKRKVFKDWLKFLQDGTCFPAGKAEFAALKDAPDFEAYKERARNAPL